MLTTKDMKHILAEKLKAENTYFTLKDIHMTKHGNSYKIFIKDYENILFIMKISIDPDDGEEITLWKQWKDKHNKILLNLEVDHSEESVRNTLLYLGYYIASRF